MLYNANLMIIKLRRDLFLLIYWIDLYKGRKYKLQLLKLTYLLSNVSFYELFHSTQVINKNIDLEFVYITQHILAS